MLVEKIMVAGLSLRNQLTEQAAGVAPLAAKCLPQDVTDGLDTVKLWVWIIGGSLFGIALMGLAITMAFNHRRGEAGESVKGIGLWIAAVIVFGAATAIVQVFLGAATNCTPA